MSGLARFGISMDSELLEQFDALVETKGYVNRSEAIRDLVRGALVDERSARGNEEIVGTVTIVYDHHIRGVSGRLTEHQHGHHDSVISVLHVHLNPRDCLEVIVVKGRADEVKRLADNLIGMKGVKHGKLVMTTAGKDMP